MMRNLFLMLVLANFAVFAAYNWVIERPEARPPYQGPGITLMQETEAIADQAGAVLPLPAVVDEIVADGADAGAAIVEAGPRCISIGPFTADEAADEARARLTEAGFDPQPAVRESEVWEGYWVYLERIDSQQAAREIAAELDANGIDDTQIIPNTDSGVVLSLGVFSEISRAGTQAERVSQLGYDATIADSMRTAETQWLDVSLTGEESLALDLLQIPGTISRLEQVACGAAQ